MKQEYELTQDEFAEIKSIAQDSTPVMKFGNYWSGMDKQDRANAFWKLLGEKHGFVWDSATPVPGKAMTFFYATPTRPKEEKPVVPQVGELAPEEKDLILSWRKGREAAKLNTDESDAECLKQIQYCKSLIGNVSDYLPPIS
jgi:hypothetical protein